jgi:hypothetical protein
MANQRTDPQDIIIVKNVDIDCDDVSSEVTPTTRKVTDPDTQQVQTLYEQTTEEFSHRDYFQVKWGSKPFRLKPGEERRMPRFIAEHFAKHLANHMLSKREEKEDRKGLVQSITERPKMLGAIMVKVDEYYLQDDSMTEGDKAAAQVDALNPQEEARAVNMGVVPPTAVGVLMPEPPSLESIMKTAGEGSKEEVIGTPVADDLPPMPEEAVVPNPAPNNAPQGNVEPPTHADKAEKASDQPKTSIFDKDKPLPERKDLLKAAYEMGLKVTGKESTDRLVSMIKSF